MASRVWTCQRRTNGIKCGTTNPRKYQVCRGCGKRRPVTKKPAHLQARELPYEEYVARTGGEFCSLCGATPKPGRKLHRDHDHSNGGSPRALLCFRCNAALRSYMTPEWLRAAAGYLERWAVRA